MIIQKADRRSLSINKYLIYYTAEQFFYPAFVHLDSGNKMQGHHSNSIRRIILLLDTHPRVASDWTSSLWDVTGATEWWEF